MTKLEEYEAMADAMNEVELIHNPYFIKLVEALRSAQDRADASERRFQSEHFVHHNGITKDKHGALPPATRPAQCGDARAIIPVS